MGHDQKIKNEFGKHIKELLKKLASSFAGWVTVVAAIIYVIADKVFDATGQIYIYAICIVIIGYFLAFIAMLIVNAIFNVRIVKQEVYEELKNNFCESCGNIDIATKNINQTNEELNTLVTILTKDIEKARSIVTEIEIGQYVLNGRDVINLESSVGNYEESNKKCKIYIQSSLFVLEKGPLEKTILWNLRKGVKYIYIIPNEEVPINNYYEMLRDWYRLFSNFLKSKNMYIQLQKNLDGEPKYKEFWCHEYQQIYEEVGKIWFDHNISSKTQVEKVNEYSEKCKKLFRSLIETHVDASDEFYITVAAYEVKRWNWEAIIKLPTQNTNAEYYAFQIPTENNSEKSIFMQKFQGRFKSYNYVPKDISTLGGKLQLDFSRIFD